MRDLRLSHAQFGLLGGAFFALFPISALLAGPLVDRWSSKWIVAGVACIWTIAQVVMSLASALPAAIASRVLLGAGEGPAFPNALHAAYSVLPENRRPTATALLGLGAPLGLASGALIVTWAAVTLGWRATFAMLGVVSLVWSIVWVRARVSREVLNGEVSSAPLRSIAFNATAFGVIVAAFGVYWILALAVTWFPASLETIGDLSPVAVGRILGASWLLQALAFPIAARFCEALQRRGYSSELAFAVPASLGVIVSGVALVGLGFASGPALSGFLVALCLCFVALSVTCLPPIVAEVTTAAKRGTALGLFAAISSTAGIAAPIVFGRIVDMMPLRDVGYRAALSLSGVLLLCIAFAALILMRPSRHRALDIGEDLLPTY